VAHSPTDVRELDADFYAFSSHKLFGPTGVGVLYGKAELLEAMPPYQAGGDMIESVTFEKTTYAPLPAKFEAGTPNIAGVVGLGAALDFVQSIGFDAIHAHEQTLLKYATEQLQSVPRLRIIGTAKDKAGVISFVIEDPTISSYDIGMALDRDNIAVRTGHHCCQPVMDRMNISSTSRASFAMYNTVQEIDALVVSLRKLVSATAQTLVAAKRSTEIDYPPAAAPSPSLAAEELCSSFELFDDRESRADYVMELSRKLPNHFDLLKKVTARVPGCMSEVYLVARKFGGSDDRLEFVADANAEIVRGLIVILEKLFSGQRAQDILGFDVETFFNKIGLDQFITTQRRNGLAGMVNRIRQEASAVKASERK
jgi:cysteine desulfurase/selenocysteine lyase